MAFKKPAYKQNGVTVKNSYYTFSKEYPVGNIGRQSRNARHKKGKRIYFKAFLLILCFSLISFAAYFSAEVALKFSYKDPALKAPEISTDSSEDASSTILRENNMKALYFPAERLGNKKFLKDFPKEIRRKNCNSVVIDFKLSDGRLLYSSELEIALLAKCAVFDNETVRSAMNFFKSEKINVIARVHCFRDNLATGEATDYAVKYMNSEVNWVDNSNEAQPCSWLNPYSKGARKYLTEIIKEISEFGIDGLILTSVSFPAGENSDTAGYPGSKGKTKEECLKGFLSEVKKVIPPSCFLLTELTSTDVVEGNNEKFGGSFSQNSADGVCADTAIRPENYYPDKKSKFSAMISLFSNMKASLNEDAQIVPMISSEEFSHSYIRTAEKNGFGCYIIYNTEGFY